MKRVAACVLGGALSMGVSSGCLPADTRPPPGTVLVRISAARPTLDGVTTADGWKVSFERALVVLGRASLDGDACTSYADADYFHYFDGRASAPQKVALLFGRGTCNFSFAVRLADGDTKLSNGVVDADATFMRTAGDDPYVKGFGIAIFLRGRAEKGGVVKTFTWADRHERFKFEKCNQDGGDKPLDVTLGEGDARTLDLKVHAEAVLQDLLFPSKSRLRFDPIARADDAGDKNGDITFEELDTIKLADTGVDAAELVNELDVAANWKSLGEMIYDGLMPRTVRLGDLGLCGTSIPPSEE